ncbi:MAG: glycine--tRNA ligase [Candidatus Micrarchaeota archaeon]
MAGKTEQAKKSRFDEVMEICLKRGIYYPSAEIYGSLAGFYDYGSVGTPIKRKLEDYWRWYFLKSLDESFYEIQGTEITHPKIWKASGHLEHFEDPIVQCKKCKGFERADQIIEKELNEVFEGLSKQELDRVIKEHKIKCHKCGGELSEVDVLNLMFSFEAGVLDSKTKVFLRPETAQTPYVNFKREYMVNREKLPLGLAVIGKAFRNEISPRQAFFRTREFTQAECQIFFDPEKVNEHARFDEVKDYKIRVTLADERKEGEKLVSCADLVKKGYAKFYVYYMARMQQFYDSLGVPAEKLRFFEKSAEERSFYNKYHFDLEIWYDMFGKYAEAAALHYRTDHDLAGHEKVANMKLSVVKDGKRILPHVIEITFGIDRNVFAFIDLGYSVKKDIPFLALPKQISPYIAAVFPLVNKDGLQEKAKEVYDLLKKSSDVYYDEGGSIGKRYARADEIGVFYCLTADHQTLEDGTVTVRNRDTAEQKRVKISELHKELS